MRTRHRHVHRAPDLTSLVDVLFILVFAALLGSVATQVTVAKPAPPAPEPPRLPATPPAVAALRAHALAQLGAQLAAREPLVIRVAPTGVVTAIEAGGRRLALDAPLLEHSPDPDIGVAYLGDRSAELRVCRIAALHLRVPSLADHLVIVAPAVALADLPHALHQGLHRDLERCLTDQRGVATIIDPAALVPAAPGVPPVPEPTP